MRGFYEMLGAVAAVLVALLIFPTLEVWTTPIPAHLSIARGNTIRWELTMYLVVIGLASAMFFKLAERD
jgi:hypothetical protein